MVCTTLTISLETSTPCINIYITHRNWSDPKNAVIGFYSDTVDGRYAEGDRAWGWGGYPKPTDEEYLQTVAIPKTLDYLGGNFQTAYGREMKITDICGQEAKDGSSMYINFNRTL